MRNFTVTLKEPYGCGHRRRKWNIKFTARLDFIGLTEWETRTIWLNTTYPEDKIYATLMHEITHVGAPCLDEDYVLALEANFTATAQAIENQRKAN